MKIHFINCIFILEYILIVWETNVCTLKLCLSDITIQILYIGYIDFFDERNYSLFNKCESQNKIRRCEKKKYYMRVL